jgi:hypothetical protein
MNNLVAGDIMTARIKELQKELAELKASIPKIQYDTIMEAEITDHYLIGYAKNILTQAKEQS